MAIDLYDAVDGWLLKRADSLLTAVAEQEPSEWSAQKQNAMELAALDERMYCHIHERGLTEHFVSLLWNPEPDAALTTLRFLQNAVQYEDEWARVLREHALQRSFQLLGVGHSGDVDEDEDIGDRDLAHAACVLLCRLGRNEQGHRQFLEYAYSWSDMMKTRDWLQERACVGVMAWVFANPHIMMETTGVLNRSDLLQRCDLVYKKSHDFIARRLALTCLEVTGMGKLLLDQNIVITRTDRLRYLYAAREGFVYFSVAASWALLRHTLRWGIAGNAGVWGAIFAASGFSGLVAAGFGVYTGELLRYRSDKLKWRWLDDWGREQRLRSLEERGLKMQPVIGRQIAPQASNSERYVGLGAVTGEVHALTLEKNRRAAITLALLAIPLPWYLVVPRFMSTYQQLRLGPAFHRTFPALSMKYTPVSRAVVPYALAPAVAVKLACVAPASSFIWDWAPEGMAGLKDPLRFWRI